MEFALFGNNDVGRYKSVEAAKNAIDGSVSARQLGGLACGPFPTTLGPSGPPARRSSSVAMPRTFETVIQQIRHDVLTHLARMALERTLEHATETIPALVIPGKQPRFRCCVHRERAVVRDRVKLALGASLGRAEVPEAQVKHGVSQGIVQVIEEACEECPVDRFIVTEACQGCLNHPCMDACKLGAIVQVNRRAYIHQDKCVDCGRCFNACPFGAIVDRERPCIRACPVKAISYGEEKIARIDYRRCVDCGLCALKCPFGAISDTSSITEIVEVLRDAPSDPDAPGAVHAIAAPAIAAQLPEVDLERVIGALRRLGFAAVHEAAHGADLVLPHEAAELEERVRAGSFLTSSCCPAWVDIIRRHFPSLSSHVSSAPSPMIAMGRHVRSKYPGAVTVFLGPCIAKKAEAQKPESHGAIDWVLTFEEVLALLDAAGIDIASCDGVALEQASCFGRAFARCGGVGEAVAAAVEEARGRSAEERAVTSTLSGEQARIGTEPAIQVRPVVCDGATDCIRMLRQTSSGMPPGNFLEGMSCEGGCVGGPGSLNHSRKARALVNEYSRAAAFRTISQANTGTEPGR
jgi:[FeFe] hydrogenase (group B1/B3)